MGNDIPFIKRSCDALFPAFDDIFKEAEAYKAFIFELSLPMTSEVINKLKLYDFVPVVENNLYVQLNKNNNMMVIACDTNYDYKMEGVNPVNEDLERKVYQLESDVTLLKSMVIRTDFIFPTFTVGGNTKLEEDLLYTAKSIKQQRDDYLDIIDDMFIDSCTDEDTSGTAISGWLDCSKNPILGHAGDLLVSLGRFEKHPTADWLYRRR